jgi:glycosyltransferase involved in cell wall biosynthesis
MVARLLWAKGVGEFVEAARRVKAECPRSRFRLLGALASDHRDGVPEATVRQWVKEGAVEYPGVVEDVRPHLAQADCVVLPSYREGMPRSLLEAAASALPVIAADSVGCRDSLDDGVTGFLCRPRDPEDLARQMLRLLAMPLDQRRRMGDAGRSKMEREFDEGRVIEAYRQRVNAILSDQDPRMRKR